jgi:hypothetical protein
MYWRKINIILVKNNVEENGNQPFFFWRKMDSGGKRYLIFGGKWSRPLKYIPLSLKKMSGGQVPFLPPQLHH